MRQNEIGDRRLMRPLPDRVAGEPPPAGPARLDQDDRSSASAAFFSPGRRTRHSTPGWRSTSRSSGWAPSPSKWSAVSAMGVHCAFRALAPDMHDHGHAARTARSRPSTGPSSPLAQNAARQVEFVLKQAVNGRAPDPRAALRHGLPADPGTNPQQYETSYLRVFEDLLPAIQEPLLVSDNSMVFCLAIDRNGYIPVHNRKASAAAASGRLGLEHGELPQQAHLRRPRRHHGRPLDPALRRAVLCARHGRRRHGDDARGGRADPPIRPALGRLPHRLPALRPAGRA